MQQKKIFQDLLRRKSHRSNQATCFQAREKAFVAMHKYKFEGAKKNVCMDEHKYSRYRKDGNTYTDISVYIQCAMYSTNFHAFVRINFYLLNFELFLKYPYLFLTFIFV